MSIARRTRKISGARSSPRKRTSGIAWQCSCCSATACGKALFASSSSSNFDHYRRRLTIFTKGERVREVPIPDPSFWDELGRLIIEDAARTDHYLLPRQKAIPKGKPPHRRSVVHRSPDKPMGDHGLHDWWYRCLARGGVVPAGTTRGERMHKARHTAGQRVLDKTGNLKAVQKLLGHASIQTTADIYTDWDIEQLTQTMREVLAQDDS
jgi:integrase